MIADYGFPLQRREVTPMWVVEVIRFALQIAITVVVSVVCLMVMITILALWRNDAR